MENEIDKRIEAYNQGVKDGKSHSVPSKQTSDFIIETKQTMATFASDIKSIKDKMEEVPTKAEMELAVTNAVQKVLDCCDTKYASSSRVTAIEKIVYGAIGIILTAFIGSLIYLVFK